MAYPEWGNATAPVKCCGCKRLIVPGQDIWVKSKGVYYCGDCGLIAENAPDAPKENGIEESLVKELADFPDEAADRAMAKSALYMARMLDCGEVAPRDIPAFTKEIRLLFLQLLELYPPAEDGDDTETRRERLAERRRREQGGI